jgi:ethanolamine utilization protein EutA
VGDEDELTLTSVGIDIGSTTTHLVFSRLIMQRRDSRYVVAERAVLRESAIHFTPFRQDAPDEIDEGRLRALVEAEYAACGLPRAAVDTGALILTGLAASRANARGIGEIFAAEAGKFVLVSAGDALEAVLAAHGSGTARLSAGPGAFLNVDIGGGTTKLALCAGGRVDSVTAIDVGARLIVCDPDEVVRRIEPAGRYIAELAGAEVAVGAPLGREARRAVAGKMAEIIVGAARGRPPGGDARPLFRLPPLPAFELRDVTTVFSGGVAEYMGGSESRDFGDLGSALGHEVSQLAGRSGITTRFAQPGIRSTVMGASQYLVQLSGSTIFVDPIDALPVRNVPVFTIPEPAAPDLAGPGRGRARRQVLEAYGETAVAVVIRWQGSATFDHLSEVADDIVAGLGEYLDSGRPLIIVTDGDVGGLLGMHLRTTSKISNPVISIDGVSLQDFDYIDIGSPLAGSGTVPVVIKSLAFPDALIIPSPVGAPVHYLAGD